MEYFTVENCTPEQLDELRSALFWADDTGPLFDDLGRPCLFPGDVPTWRVYQEYARICFTDDDFSCSASMTPPRWYQISADNGHSWTRQYITGAEAAQMWRDHRDWIINAE